MSCIRSSDSDEPEFEQVTLRHPAITNTIAAAARMFMPTANSSPKLRLDFDNNDSLMADADFYSFLNHRNELKSQGERRDLDEDCKDEDQHVSSPLLPPSPAFTNAGGEIANTQHGTIDDARCRLEHLAVGTEKKNSTSSQDVNTDDSSDRSSTDMEMKIRPVPRPSSILPRDGTVTALPGSTMQTPGIDESKKGDHACEYSNFSSPFSFPIPFSWSNQSRTATVCHVTPSDSLIKNTNMQTLQHQFQAPSHP